MIHQSSQMRCVAGEDEEDEVSIGDSDSAGGGVDEEVEEK